ncbi:hypothetical protein [Leptospira neocaledonica]|uniref:General secretion pathway protein GspM n=1 Tax=Leptospira neocaledonica TaxID=2023192 RepID=A0A2N0A2Z1_9LEPT|nr:hypothetical protein [Leptospira neocaledonica]PJZ78696.1 hypothetical protein CH365_00225 [Leptospira neocaledonica]
MLQKLQPREKILVLVAAGLVVLLLAILVVRKIYKLRTDLSETVSNTPGLVAQLDSTISEYLFFRGLESVNTGENDQSTFAAKLEKIFTDNGVKERISTMRPIPARPIDKDKYQVIIFEVSLRGVPLENIMTVLYDIEKGNKVNARVEYFQTNKPYQDKNTYDVNMKIAAYSVAPGK